MDGSYNKATGVGKQQQQQQALGDQLQVKITIKTIDKKGYVNLYVDEGILIQDLLTPENIQALQLSATDHHYLFFGGRKLEADRQLSHYNISSGSTILCAVRDTTNCTYAIYPTSFVWEYVHSDEEDGEDDNDEDDNSSYGLPSGNGGDEDDNSSDGLPSGNGGDEDDNSSEAVAEGVDDNEDGGNNEGGDKDNFDVVYFVYLILDKEFSDKLCETEQQHDGSTEFSTLLRQLTKIGRAANWKDFMDKISHLRTWNNFAAFQCVALSYPGNSEDAENALHLAYSAVRHAGEWFLLNMFDRACVASLFERAAERLGGVVRYFRTSWALGCSFVPRAIDTQPNGQVYFAEYGLGQRVIAVLVTMLNDNNTSNSVKGWCRRIMSTKIGCAWRTTCGYPQGEPARGRLKNMLWACGFLQTIYYRTVNTHHPMRDEKLEHINQIQNWSGYGEWFNKDDGEKQPLNREDRNFACHDVDFYSHLISTGFISMQTVQKLADDGRIMF